MVLQWPLTALLSLVFAAQPSAGWVRSTALPQLRLHPRVAPMPAPANPIPIQPPPPPPPPINDNGPFHC